MKLALCQSELLDDWYTIEQAEHDNRSWFEPTGPNSSKFMYSGRISDACVEGPASEMLEIAQAIKARGSVSFRRCAVRVAGDTAYFCSPRNSSTDAVVPLADAAEFAEYVVAALGNKEFPT